MEVLGYLIGLAVAVIPAAIWVWTLIDVIRSEFDGSNKIIWLLVVLFLPLIGMALYWLFGRNQKVGKRSQPSAG